METHINFFSALTSTIRLSNLQHFRNATCAVSTPPSPASVAVSVAAVLS